MNKVILGLILAVCILGMALVMLNERLGKKNDYAQSSSQVAESGFSQDTNVIPEKVDVPTVTETYKASPGIADEIVAREREQAKAALAPPIVQPATPADEMSKEQEREALRIAAGVQLESEAGDVKVSQNPIPKAQPQRLSEQPVYEPQKPLAQKPMQEKPQKPKPIMEQPAKPKIPEAKPRPKNNEDEKPYLAAEQTAKPKPPAEKPKTAAEPAEKTTAQAKPETPKTTQGQDIKRFVVFARENGATVRITGNGAMAYRSMTLDNPPRVVLDLDGEWKFPANPGIPKNAMVNNVRIGKSSGNKTRVVIDLKEKPKNARVIASKDGDGFDVRVDK